LNDKQAPALQRSPRPTFINGRPRVRNESVCRERDAKENPGNQTRHVLLHPDRRCGMKYGINKQQIRHRETVKRVPPAQTRGTHRASNIPPPRERQMPQADPRRPCCPGPRGSFPRRSGVGVEVYCCKASRCHTSGVYSWGSTETLTLNPVCVADRPSLPL